MSHLPFEQPVEGIVFQLICEGVHRHKIAMKALLEDGGFSNDTSTLLYFETVYDILDALNDAYIYASLSLHPKMKKVMDTLNDYCNLVDEIYEDGIFACKLTEEDVIRMSTDAGKSLDLALEISHECVDIPDFPFSEDGKP